MTTNSEHGKDLSESADALRSGSAERRAKLPDDANPFSTARVQPGSLPYLFATGESLSGLIDRLSRQRRRGQIVGPHGVGKSTLLVQLARELAAAGDFVEVRRIGPQQTTGSRMEYGHPRRVQLAGSRSPAGGGKQPRWLFVDGWEQLPTWRRWWIAESCRWRGVGLVATCHDDGGLPELIRLEVNLERLCRLVANLLEGFPPWVSETDVKRLWERQPTNAREILFSLYDLYEVRRRSNRPQNGS